MRNEDRIIPIPLRDGVTAFLDLPFDMTPEEADKVARVVKALATGRGEGKARGGHAAAEAMTPEQRTARAKKAAKTRWRKK